MKANELMIGDWVVYNGDVEYTDPICIEGMDIATNSLITSDREDVGFDGVCPIPLTPEILEKNGFTRYGQVYANLQQWVGKFGDKRKVLVQDIRTGEWGTNDVWINYVHELQHVLKLCKIEKNIEL